MKIGELAFKIHVHSRMHAWRLASAGIVPGTKRTKGGQFYFVKSYALNRWINYMKAGGAFRRKEMSRAYKKHYGSKILKEMKQRREIITDYRKTERQHRFAYAKNIRYSDRDYFSDFFWGMGRVEAFLKFWQNISDEPWMSEVNEEIIARITLLSEQIEKAKKSIQQQSSRT